MATKPKKSQKRLLSAKPKKNQKRLPSAKKPKKNSQKRLTTKKQKKNQKRLLSAIKPKKKSQKRSRNLLAKGGGDATAIGVRFQATLGALIEADLLAERPLDQRLKLGAAKPVWVRFETEAPLDDILVATDAGGIVGIQAKASLNKGSEFDKTAEQIVRHYLECLSGDGDREWNRPLAQIRDRLVIAVGPKSSAFIRDHLADGLNARRQPGKGITRPLSKDQGMALATFDASVKKAWSAVSVVPITQEVIDDLSRLTFVLTYNFESADWKAAATVLGTALASGDEGERVLISLVKINQDLMGSRSGVDGQTLRVLLGKAGIKLQAAEAYRADVTALQKYSTQIQKWLKKYEEIEVSKGKGISIHRACQPVVLDAAIGEGSLLIIGEPGTGKSAVINAVARELRSRGYDVLQLAVDRLSVSTAAELSGELDLQHRLIEVLKHWDGVNPGYIVIDALDATRGGTSEGVFRNLISELFSDVGRWKVIASIRTFDLRFGQQFRSLFKGLPPVTSHADPNFPDVRHIQVPKWTDQELKQLLSRAPVLRDALSHTTVRVRELAGVPFNTRLLAELVLAGIKSKEFGTIDSQVELLDLYWRHRVAVLGLVADLRLKRVVELMVKASTLRAPRIEAGEGDPKTLDALGQQGVLITSADERYVSFRHHILFDYTASRVYLNPDEIISGKMIFPKSVSLGLMLGPALNFVLRELWNRDVSRKPFWDAIIRLLQDDNSDPVIRIIAARVASELPMNSSDTQYFSDEILDDRKGAVTGVAQIVGALAVRIEDKESTEITPWTSFAARLINRVKDLAWPLRTLCYLLIENARKHEDRVNMGAVSRALLTFALEQEYHTGLVDSAIGFVADTYATDSDSSRSLLRQVFDDTRFSKFGPEEVPDLARKIDVIAVVDPDFAVEIYGEIYKKSVEENREITIGGQIMPLITNAKQDFKMARYSLSQFFPKFLATHPEHAVDALIEALEGFIDREHSSERTKGPEIKTGGRSAFLLVEDGSSIWGWDPDGKHREDAEVLIAAFRKYLLAAPPDDAKRIAQRVINKNQLAVLWSRLFMVAAERPDVLGDMIWNYATQEPFLMILDTRKDAIDAIASFYPTRSVDDRRMFEKSVFNFVFSTDDARNELSLRLFTTIGIEFLITEEAKSRVNKAVRGEINKRPFNFEVTSGSSEPYWWFEKKANLESEENANLRKAIDRAKMSLGLNKKNTSEPLRLTDAIVNIRDLKRAIAAAEAAGAADELRRYAVGILAEGVEKTAGIKELKNSEKREVALELVEIVLELTKSPFPEIDDDIESKFEKSASWGSPAPRIDAAQAALDLCSLHGEVYQRLHAEIEYLLSDKHPAVRLVAAQRLVRLWDTDRARMWSLAEAVIRNEKNLGVLDHFTNSFFNMLLHHAPDDVENLVLLLFDRFAGDDRDRVGELFKNLSPVVAILSVIYVKPKSGKLLESWIKNPIIKEQLLERSLHQIQGSLIAGYDGATEKENERIRGQAFIARCVEVGAQHLETYLKKTERSESENNEARTAAMLLDSACSQLYFASGALKSDEKGLPNGESRRRFLVDIEATLRRIGDVGTPHTIYNLLQLLEFLLPADPVRVFDIVAHALVNGGRLHGYQYESLGSDLFVRMIGQYLADHREIFDDATRRQLLISCLEIFQTAGWPSARRLLYRLPELLQ